MPDQPAQTDDVIEKAKTAIGVRCAVWYDHDGEQVVGLADAVQALDDAGLLRTEPTPADEQRLNAKREAVREARKVISQYLVTAEKWRYDRVMWAFAIMLGEIPEDTPEPLSPSDVEALCRRPHTGTAT
ncbi:hypothetical protein [Prauserella endophytica]|uniref:Uncharacterized protein n=1 Tax=Prauserella endophytica TaxID=1592324 RepID=A0ABY2S1P9_9PSEU|nr:hypothetical protein [Prauserella endophytica]PXY20339.1 hypothetical protein BAY59_31370 [Prauserella coralliicola]TKG66941.1 hypothetical protein FCN18_23815 [Prauserella endophytica]